MKNFADELTVDEIVDNYISQYSGPINMTPDRVKAGLIMFNKRSPNKLVRFRNCFMMHVKNTAVQKHIMVVNGNDVRRTLVDCMMYAIQLGLDNKKLNTVSFHLFGDDFSEASNLFGDTASLEEGDEGQSILNVNVPSLIKLGKKRG